MADLPIGTLRQGPMGGHVFYHILNLARRAGSDGSMSASGSAGPGFDPRRGSKFNLKIFNLGARRGGYVHFLIGRLYITVLD